MKKISKIIFSIAVFLFVFSTPSYALVLPPDQDIVPFGQNHAYTVTFRGNGEAIVNFRTSFYNSGKSNLSTLSFNSKTEIGGNISAYQLIREPQCRRYDYSNNQPQTCLEYEEPDYFNTYWYGKTSYLKAEVAQNGDQIAITLPAPVAPGKSGSIVMYYLSNQLASKSFLGTFDYKFETLASEDQIKNLQVGVTTDSNLYLKGADSQVQYRDVVSTDATQKLMAAGSENISNSQFDSYYQQIGSGQIIESATYLQPTETFTVHGSYADSQLKLYSRDILTWSLVVLVLILLIIFSVFFVIKKLKTQNEAEKNSNAEKNPKISIAYLVTGSFIASFLTAGYTIGIFIISSAMSMRYYSNLNPLVMLFLVVLSFGVYPLLLFGASLFVGIKRGVWWGLGTFAMTIFWMMIFLLVVFAYVLVSKNNVPPIYRGISPAVETQQIDTTKSLEMGQ